MIRKKAEEFLRGYDPARLTYPERMRLLDELSSALRDEEGVLRGAEGRCALLLRRIEETGEESVLREVHQEFTQLAWEEFQEGRSVREVHRLLSLARDRLTQRLLRLVEEELDSEGFGPPPSAYAWMAMGSDGRREQTLFTDQDNLLVYRYREEEGERLLALQGRLRTSLLKGDIAERTHYGPKEALEDYYELFAQRMVEKLEEIGIRKCKGGIMPVNEKWRGEIGEWKERIIGKIRHGKGPLGILDLIIMMDLRHVGGERGLGEELIAFFNDHIMDNRTMVEKMASAAILMPVPLGLFRRFATERSGEGKGTIDVKLGGWGPLVFLVRLLAKRYRIPTTNTFERIKGLEEREVLSASFSQRLQEAFYTLMRLRIERQGELMREGVVDGQDRVNPYRLPEPDQARLRDALRKVEALQKLANEVFFSGGLWR
ncbi:MAG: hypothetical protein DRG32_03940 [Deltaproteobacteria bacterium]|nr:MAG: hypothetical protein DRG32_03940 [Deltaproteobacteria bacterium]